MKTRVCLYGASNTGRTTQPDCRQRNDRQSFAPRCEANAASVFHLIMKRLLFLFAALLSCLSSMAEDVEIDGGWYSIDEESHTAVITSLATDQYTFSIPSSIVVEGQSYSVTTIEGGAFWACSSLAEIEIPNSVTTIGNDAFYGCSSLTEIEIPSGVTEIGGRAFFGCSSLTEIKIPSSVTRIGNAAFGDCSSLAKIEIPSGVTEIGVYAFYGCSSLAEIKIPNSVTTIGYSAFEGCSSLAEIEIPNSVTEIGDYAFLGCSSLTSLSVAEENPNYTSLDNVIYTKDMKTLVCCSHSKEGVFSIPNSVTTIGGYAFDGCSSLAEIEIPSGVTEIGGGAFFGCSSLAEIEIPSGVTEIGDYAFYGCSSLAEIEIPNSVTEIGGGAFYGCSSLAEIEIPNSVTTIGYSAFYGCSSLATIVSYSVTPQSSSWPESVFENVPNTATIIIPKGSKAAYEASPLWSQFTNFEESDDKTPTAMKDIKNLDGITVQNGTIIGCDNMRIYNMMGQDVTAQNGSLRGIFIVRVGEETTKVMVK